MRQNIKMMERDPQIKKNVERLLKKVVRGSHLDPAQPKHHSRKRREKLFECHTAGGDLLPICHFSQEELCPCEIARGGGSRRKRQASSNELE